MRRVLLAFLAFLLLTSACAGGPPALDDSAAREVDRIDTTDPASAETIAAEPVSLRLAVPADTSLDPADAGAASLTNRVVSDLLYEGLTSLDDDSRPQPALADRWFVSDDRLLWTFVLSAGLVDGAGEPITARDVKASLERVARRGPADQAATALTAIAGWADLMAGDAGGVAGLSATDDSTLVVRLDSPYELLPEVLAAPAFGVTGEREDGSLRTSGAYALGDESDVFEALDPDAPVTRVELVRAADGPAAAMAEGDADWAVLANGEGAGGLPADIVRQPLELNLAMVARSPLTEARLGLLGALEPLLLATEVDGLIARPAPATAADGAIPDAALVEVLTGPLARLTDAVVAQLEAAGVAVVPVESDEATFAARVASGDALLFPVVIAGGTGPGSALLRVAVPGASDDVFGPESEARAELAEAVVSELDIEQRVLLIDALERSLIDSGLLLPIGQFEVRVALGHRLDGLRHRADGTLDLTEVRPAERQ
jgi:hypothetical protein